MRKLAKPIVVTAVSTVLVAGFSVSAPASIGAKSTKKFCKLAANVTTTELTAPTATPEDAAAKTVKDFKKLIKLAPSKDVKKAAKTLRGIYADVAQNGPPAELSQEFTEAAVSFSGYVATHCAG